MRSGSASTLSPTRSTSAPRAASENGSRCLSTSGDTKQPPPSGPAHLQRSRAVLGAAAGRPALLLWYSRHASTHARSTRKNLSPPALASSSASGVAIAGGYRALRLKSARSTDDVASSALRASFASVRPAFSSAAVDAHASHGGSSARSSIASGSGAPSERERSAEGGNALSLTSGNAARTALHARALTTRNRFRAHGISRPWAQRSAVFTRGSGPLAPSAARAPPPPASLPLASPMYSTMERCAPSPPPTRAARGSGPSFFDTKLRNSVCHLRGTQYTGSAPPPPSSSGSAASASSSASTARRKVVASPWLSAHSALNARSHTSHR